MKKYAATALAVLIGTPAWAVETYTMDPNHTKPFFEVNHLGFSTQRGRFDKTAGKITLDRQKPQGAVDFSIETASISMGMDKWNEHLRSEDFFNVAKFPTVTYQSDRIQFAGDIPVAAEGILTLLGVGKPVRVAIQNFTCGVNPINQKFLCAADIEASLKRSEFGMTKYLPGVGDEVKVKVPVEAYRD